MFILGKLKVYLIVAGVLAVSGYGLWQYYKYNQNLIVAYANEAAKAEAVIGEQDIAIKQLQEDNRLIILQLNEVTEKFKDAQARVSDLSDKLARHDLGTKGAIKPGLVEKIINNGSEQANRCFEIAAGSPLTEEEKSATVPSKINTLCLSLIHI